MGFTMETGVVGAEAVADAVREEVGAGIVAPPLRIKVANGKVKVWAGPTTLDHKAVAAALSAHLPEAVESGRAVEVLAITNKGAKVRLVPVAGDEAAAAEPAEEEVKADAEQPQ